MPRILLLLLGLLAVLAVGSQLLIPALAERKVADRLEEEGGSADVSLGAFPAVRLLFDDGDSFEVEGRGLRLHTGQRERVLERLDGFDEVRVRLEELDAGPVEAERFELVREEGEKAYRMTLTGSTTPREVARFLGDSAGGPLGGILGDLAAGTLLGGGNTPLPVRLDAVVESRAGEARVVRSSATVAGLPAGPLAQVVLDAVVRRL